MHVYQIPDEYCPSPTDDQLLDAAGALAGPIIEAVRPLLARGEYFCHLAVQDPLRAMSPWPSALVLTNRRVMVVRRRLMGQTFLDMFWGEVHDAHLMESWKGGTFAVQSVQGHDLRVDALPVALSRPAYAFAQRAEELASEWRRARRLEEERARSRGVAITDLPPAPARTPTQDASGPEATLRRLAELRDKGLISDEEYQSKRNDVISRL